MPEVHRTFFHYSELPLSMRTLFTAALIVLGIGYMFAMVQVYEIDAGRDGKPGLSAADIAIAYSGSRRRRDWRRRSGPMSGMLPEEERATIIDWVRRGRDKAEYEAQHQADHRAAMLRLPRRQQPAHPQPQQL